MNPFERKTSAAGGRARPRSIELYNDATHDSTVDTDGKNREAARIASGGPISPDQMTTSNASLVNAMPETPDGFAGFDSRPGGNRPQFALRAGYAVVDKGSTPPHCATRRWPTRFRRLIVRRAGRDASSSSRRLRVEAGAGAMSSARVSMWRRT